MSEPATLETLRRLALTLGLAAAGGAVFVLIGLPVPWLSGPAVSVAAGSIGGLPLGIPLWLRRATLVFLGATMGASVTPETLALIGRWPISLAGLAVCVWAIVLSVSFYLERVHRFDRATARLAAVPGALPYVLALTADSHADPRRVAIIQMSRLAMILICLPSLLTALGAHGGGLQPPRVAPVALHEIALLLAAGAAGGFLFERLKVPAGSLFGAMIAGAVLYGSGMLTSGLPPWLMLPGFLVIGAMVGSNFVGTDAGLFRDTLIASIGSVLIGATVAVVCALTTSALLGLPAAQLWLAYAPGGVETMTIMAMALGLDPAFVGGHHVARFLGLGLTLPLWFRAFLKRDGVSS
jgi:hypothetical protein